MPFATANGYRLAYRLKRDGPASLVFIHGLGASKNSFGCCFGKACPRALYLSSVSLVKESCLGNLNQRFSALPVKKWYVFGERSVNRSIRSFLEANKIPYFIVPESGHFMMDDQPGVLYRMLFEVLETCK